MKRNEELIVDSGSPWLSTPVPLAMQARLLSTGSSSVIPASTPMMFPRFPNS